MAAASSLRSSLDEGLRLLDLPRVDQVSDVVQQFASGSPSLWPLQGGEVVPHDGGPVVAATRVVQPDARSLGSAETVGAKQDVLQLLVRVAVGRGAQWADTVDQHERKLRQRPVEFCER